MRTKPDAILRRRLPLAAAVGVGLLAVVDQTRFVAIGAWSLSALLTVAIAGIFVFLLPVAPLSRSEATGRRLPRVQRIEPLLTIRWRTVPLAITLLLIWGAVSLLLHPTSFAVQNMAAYLGFFLAIPLTAYMSSASTADIVMKISGWIALVASSLFIAATLAGVEIYGERAFAAVALIYLATLVPNRSNLGLIRVAPYVVTAAIVLGLSRSAAAVALVMLLFLVVRNGRRQGRALRAVFRFAVLATAGLAVIWNYAPFRERFFGGDEAIQLSSGLTFNTSGRDRIWALVVEGWAQSPWFGNGIGSAQELVTGRLGAIAHPHNEYLRILHDFGAIGLILFLLGMFALALGTWRRALTYDEPQHWAAFLSIAAILALSVTDNPLVYVFVVVPAGALIGLSMSAPPPPWRSITRSGSRQVLSATAAQPVRQASLQTRS